MNRFVRDMLMARYDRNMQDGRNPYGSRGGYVVSSRRGGRDRDMEDYGEDYARGGRGGDRGMNDYGEYDMDYARGGNQRSGGRGRDRGMSDYADYDMARGGGRDRADRGDMGYRNYDMRRGDYGSYDMRSRDYGMDYGYGDGRDYGEEAQYGKLSKKDMEKWKHSLKNADGSHGEHFKKEHIEQIAKQMGVDMERMGGEDVFVMAVNMMYADYCDVAKKFGIDRPEYYVALAKAFLEDKDFQGKGEEKLYLYYKCIAEQED